MLQNLEGNQRETLTTPTVLEESSGGEVNNDKDAEEERSSLSEPQGHRVSKRSERRDYRGLC